MKRQQRFKYEMFVRVRDFGTAHAALFPEASKGGQAFARVLAATAAIEEHLKNHVLGKAEARRIKAATRESVFDYLKTIAAAARRVTRVEPAVSPFVMPRHRSLAAELATARAFMEEAVSRQAEFEQFGLPSTFISDFKALVDRLQQAADVRLSSKTVRRKAQAGISHRAGRGARRRPRPRRDRRDRHASGGSHHVRRVDHRAADRGPGRRPREAGRDAADPEPRLRRCRLRSRRPRPTPSEPPVPSVGSWRRRREPPAAVGGARLPQRHHRPLGRPRLHHHRARLSHAGRRRARRHPPGEAAPRGPGDSRRNGRIRSKDSYGNESPSSTPSTSNDPGRGATRRSAL